MVKLTVGPVIGHVTTNSANILCEVDEDCPGLTCTLTLVDEKNNQLKESGQRQNELTQQMDFPKGIPKVYRFTGLQADMRYRITMVDIGGITPLGLVRTIPEKVDRINIGVLSCDNVAFKSEIDMWGTMWNGMQTQELNLHVLLHIGDNVYLDGSVSSNRSNEEVVDDNMSDILDPANVDQSTPYVRARVLLQGVEPDEWPSKADEILEIYRSEYRRTFGRENVRQILSHVSNLMILDDHDVRDDFGAVPQDSDPQSREFFLGGLALRTYHEYQRALWDPDIVSENGGVGGRECDLENEFYSVNLGPLGVMMLDSRTVWANNKSKRAENDTSYYGEKQMKQFKDNLYNNPETKTWIAVCPLPLFFLKKKFNELAVCLNKGNDDLSSAINNKHQDDLEDFLRVLRNWKESDAHNDMVVVSGDVHVGGFTDIYYQPKSEVESGGLLCRQITTSAINHSNRALGGVKTLSALLHFTDTYGDYTYKHHDWVNQCNFAIFCFEGFGGHPTYKVKLYHGNEIIVKDSTDMDWDKDTTSCVCNVL